MHLVSYSNRLNYEHIDNLNLDVNKVLKHHTDSEDRAQSASSVVISAAVTAYARIIMSMHKLKILSRGGKIYYSNTDSIVTDMELDNNNVSSTELGKFKLKHVIKQGVLISGNTYCLVLNDGTLVKSADIINPGNLSYEYYVSLLHKNSSGKSYLRKSSRKNQEPNSDLKRTGTKIYPEKNKYLTFNLQLYI
jgi:hypothetical protein